MKPVILVIFSAILFSCAPKEEVVFKGVKNVGLEKGKESPVLKADVLFHNPNDMRMKLKRVAIDIMVNGKKAGTVNQEFDQVIRAQADFSVPIEVTLDMKEIGLLDALFDLIGGKKYEIQYIGNIRVKARGITVKVPVNHKDEFRLKI